MININNLKKKYADNVVCFHMDFNEQEFVLRQILNSKGMTPALKVNFTNQFLDRRITLHEILEKILFYKED